MNRSVIVGSVVGAVLIVASASAEDIAKPGDGKRPVPAASASPSAAPVAAPTNKDRVVTSLAHGQKITLSEWIFPGKTTIFDFSSKYCPPCRKIKEPLIKWITGDESRALRIIDINRPDVEGIDFESPVAQQHEIHSIPAFIVYDEKGKLLQQGDEARDAIFQTLVDKGFIVW